MWPHRPRTAAYCGLYEAHDHYYVCQVKNAGGADAPQFKGIFVRNLVALDLVDPRPVYKSFVDTNADAIWDKSRGPDSRLGLVWAGPFGGDNASSQSSALDALIGAAALQDLNIR